tara:strand:- start:2314 stop:3072 length:759 start_codon:yes stop_codon:yes gene_type:complete
MDGILDDHGRPLFCKVYLWILRDYFPRLSPAAREIYIILLSFADFNTGTCFPSYRLITRRFKKSSKTIGKGLRELEDRGLIQSNQYSRRSAPVYQLAEHPEQATAWSGGGTTDDGIPPGFNLSLSRRKKLPIDPPDQDFLFQDESTGSAAYAEADRLLKVCEVNKRVALDLLTKHQPENVVEAARNALAEQVMRKARGVRNFNPAGYLIRTLTHATGPVRKSKTRNQLETHYERTRSPESPAAAVSDLSRDE